VYSNPVSTISTRKRLQVSFHRSFAKASFSGRIIIQEDREIFIYEIDGSLHFLFLLKYIIQFLAELVVSRDRVLEALIFGGTTDFLTDFAGQNF